MSSKSLETLVKNIEKKLLDFERRPAWLAKKSNLPAGHISRILNKERSPGLETIEVIAEALDCSVADLLTDHAPVVSNALLIKLGKLSDADLRVIEQFADQMLLRIEAEKKIKGEA